MDTIERNELLRFIENILIVPLGVLVMNVPSMRGIAFVLTIVLAVDIGRRLGLVRYGMTGTR